MEKLLIFGVSVFSFICGETFLVAQIEKEFPVVNQTFYPPLTAKGKFTDRNELIGDLFLYAQNGELAMRESYRANGSGLRKRIVYWPKSVARKELVPMWVHEWHSGGKETATYYCPKGQLYSHKYLNKNLEKVGIVDKLYDYTQIYYYESGNKSSTFEGYMDLQCRSFLHGVNKAFTPSGIEYAVGKSEHGKQTRRVLHQEVNSRLTNSDKREMQRNIDRTKPLLIPKVVWERATGINKYANLGGYK